MTATGPTSPSASAEVAPPGGANLPESGLAPEPPRTLRWSQWNAVRALDGHVLVTAGAGTGKTFTVVSAILYLLGIDVATPAGAARAERPLDLSEIAAITFTNQAAADLKRALRAALREHGRPDLARRVDGARVGTIHRFCGDVLREFALRSGRDPALRVLEEGEAASLIRTVAREALIDAVEASSPDAAALLERWSVRELEGWIAELLDQSDALAALEGSQLDPDARSLVALAGAASVALERALDDAGAVDFDRMIAWTRDLLRDDPRALRTLRRRVRVLIIDEFQDVDPVQKDIAYRLGGLEPQPPAAAGPTGALEPRSGAPPPDNVTRLFLVGDPKQSIYRFRRADVTVWTRVERDFLSGLGSVVPLEDSFRSTPEILGWVDATSGAQLDRPVDGERLADYEVPYLPIEPIRARAGLPAVEILLLQPDERGKRLPNDDARRAEAAWIAERALRFHADGTAWREMSVLLPAWANVGHYEEALRSAGIPAYVLRGEGFLERREVVDLILALQAIRTPRDDRALLGFMRSPFVGLRDDTLLRIARHAARPYWRALAGTGGAADAPDASESGPPGALAASAPEASRLATGVVLLRELGALRDRVPTAVLLERLLARTGYLAHLALAGEPGLEAIANVRQFLALARSAGDRSVGDFLSDLAERRARERDRVSREVPARLYAEEDDVLTVGTIHGAKGLEWRVVFCADIGRPPRGDPDAFLRVGDGLLLGDPDVPSDDRPEAWRAAAARLKAEDRAERKRQWYVAQTRARDRLLLASLPLGQRPNSGTFARELVDAFRELGAAFAGEVPDDGSALGYVDRNGVSFSARIAVRAGVGPPAPTRREAGAGSTARAPAGAAAAVAAGTDDPLAEPPPPHRVGGGPVRLSATQMLVRARCEKRHWLKYGLQIPEPETERHAAADPLIRGVVRGRIVHEVLQRYRDPEELADVIEVAIGRWDEHAPAPDTDRGAHYRAELRAEVDRVLGRPEYAELRAAPGARRELSFLRVHADGRATEGAIDLAVPPSDDESGWRLLDVKTNRIRAEEAREMADRYAPQRDVYVEAAAGLSARPVDAFTFVFSGPGVVVAQAPPPDGAAAVAAARAGIAADARPRLADDPAECVFCGYRVVGLCPGANPAGLEVPAAAGPAPPAAVAADYPAPAPPASFADQPARPPPGATADQPASPPPAEDSGGQLLLF